MAVFQYTAKDAAGNMFSGTYTDIDSKKALKRGLSKMGYTLVKATCKAGDAGKKMKSIKQADIVSFAYEFAGMYSAGLSVIRCLETVEAQLEDSQFKTVITDIRQRVETGSTLKEGFENHKNVFSDFFIGMIESGETGGRLSETLEMAASYLEKQADLRSKIKAAIAYPVVVCVMCLLIVTALIIFVIPVFQKLYSQLNISLPLPTLALIAVSRMVREYWWVITPLVVISAVMIPWLIKQKAVKQWLDAVKLKLPMVGKLNKMILVSKYVRTFAMMASSGVPIVDSLSLARKVANHAEMDEISKVLEAKVQTGNSLAETMSQFNIFPPVIVQLAGAGEEAGMLPDMLVKGTDFFDKKIERTIESLLVKIEPVLSVMLGLIVGGIMLGVYLPMFDYMGQVK